MRVQYEAIKAPTEEATWSSWCYEQPGHEGQITMSTVDMSDDGTDVMGQNVGRRQ